MSPDFEADNAKNKRFTAQNMREYRFSLTCILPYKVKIFDLVKTRILACFIQSFR